MAVVTNSWRPQPPTPYPVVLPTEILKTNVARTQGYTPAARDVLFNTPVNLVTTKYMQDNPGMAGYYDPNAGSIVIGADNAYPPSTLAHEFSHRWNDYSNQSILGESQDYAKQFARDTYNLASNNYDNAAMAANAWIGSKGFYADPNGNVPWDVAKNEFQARIAQSNLQNLPQWYTDKYWPGMVQAPSPDMSQFMQGERGAPPQYTGWRSRND